MNRPKSQNSNVRAQEAIKQILGRGVVEVIDRDHLVKRLQSGRPLRVKLGIDPTDPKLHLGHAVVLRKLHQFQMAGHQAVIIIGDWTAQIGDPSGRDKTRKPLSAEDVKRNARFYTKQIFKIVDESRAEVRWQSEWFTKLRLNQLFSILGQMSAHELLEHETFQHRLQKHLPIAVHELMYPILQGYDSVQVKADIELGAVEQKFNLLMGRKLQRVLGESEQDVVMMPYLTGIDGKQKMSKSLGNTINLTDQPEEIYGKVMSIPDSLIIEYFTLCTDLTEKALKVVANEVNRKPKDAKARLAFLITETLYDEPAAESAQALFGQVHQKKQVPGNLRTVRLSNKNINIVELLCTLKLAQSRAAARRLIQQHGVKVNGVIQHDWYKDVVLEKDTIIQVGKRHFVRIEGK